MLEWVSKLMQEKYGNQISSTVNGPFLGWIQSVRKTL